MEHAAFRSPAPDQPCPPQGVQLVRERGTLDLQGFLDLARRDLAPGSDEEEQLPKPGHMGEGLQHLPLGLSGLDAIEWG